MRFLFLISGFLFWIGAGAQQKGTNLNTVFEQSGGTESPTYFQIIDWWKRLDAASPMVKMITGGPTDAGYALNLVLVSADGDFDAVSWKRKGKVVIFINNGIHPGEPDGIDASMLLVRQAAQGGLPKNIALAIIPVYNIGGCLNRSPNFRVDQNGPVQKGFRGNSQNLDLNRDFIKTDSKEALSFVKLYTTYDPDIFIDNHVSNGADYQHVMTLLTSQHNKLGGPMGRYLNEVMEPAIYKAMKQTNGRDTAYDLAPYVNHWGSKTPDQGWPQYWDGPRYSSGYATLWNAFAFVPETHMLKSYSSRVDATKKLMESFVQFAAANASAIKKARAVQRATQQQATTLPIAWKLDTMQKTTIPFKGYEPGYKASVVSGQQRLFYDRSKPFEKQVPFYNFYKDTLLVTKPAAYVIPQGWWKVIERLQANGIAMRRLSADSSLTVEVYTIGKYNSSSRPFENHHLNSGVQVARSTQTIAFRKGDYIISTMQKGVRFLVETLEPQAPDSYFAWNFFDAILQQKEGFSDYAFEETAAAYLQQHPEVKQALEERKQKDAAFAKDGTAQLEFIYKASPYSEPAYMRYPVFRLMK